TAETTTRRSLLAALQVPLTQVLLFGALCALVVVLTGSVQRGELSVGDMVTILTLVALAATPAQLLPAAYAMYRQTRAAARRIDSIAPNAAPAEVDVPPATGSASVSIGGLFAGAGVVHGARGLAADVDPAWPVISGLFMSLPATRLVVVTGPRGAG